MINVQSKDATPGKDSSEATFGSLLKCSISFGGFLRGLFESHKMRQHFGRVPQQPEGDRALATVASLLSFPGVYLNYADTAAKYDRDR